MKKKYETLFLRLVANTTVDPNQNENGCWTWALRAHGRCGWKYPRLNIRVRGKHKMIAAHRAMLVLMEIGEGKDLFYDLYRLYGVAGFEADHLCVGNPLCINPDHLQWLTEAEHKAKTWEKYRG